MKRKLLVFFIIGIFALLLTSCKTKEASRGVIDTSQRTIVGVLEFTSESEAVVHTSRLSFSGPKGDIPILHPEKLKKYNGKNVKVTGRLSTKDVYDNIVRLTEIDSIEIIK